MHWKVKALSAVIAINLMLLLVIGLVLWFSRPGRERTDLSPPTEPPPVLPAAEVPPLELPAGERSEGLELQGEGAHGDQASRWSW